LCDKVSFHNGVILRTLIKQQLTTPFHVIKWL
jgi:hypothetical protein